MASVPKEGDIENLLEKHEEGKETPPAPPAETKPKEGETAPPAEGKPEGETGKPKEGEPAVFQAFHKHPRWITLQQDLKDRDVKIVELEAFRDRVIPLLDQLGEKPKASEETKRIPSWFVDLFGENPDAWAKYSEYSAMERKQLREEIMVELHEESRKAAEEIKKWDKKVDIQFSELLGNDDIQARIKAIGFDLSNEAQSKSFHNELLKVTLDYRPLDPESDDISLMKAFDILELQKLRKAPEKASVDRKKEIADKTMVKGKSDADRKDYKTPADLQGKTFRDLIPSE